MDDLKPCPFCGSKPVSNFPIEMEGQNIVFCNNPDCEVNPATRPIYNRAAEAWNTRHE